MVFKIIGYGVLMAIILFFLSPIMDAFNSQVTVYPVAKDDKGTEFPLNKSIYKVNTDTQTVISWFPGIAEVPTKLANCSVRDRLHWQCDYSDGSGKLLMDNNRFEINPIEPNVQYVGRLKWWRLSFGL